VEKIHLVTRAVQNFYTARRDGISVNCPNRNLHGFLVQGIVGGKKRGHERVQREIKQSCWYPVVLGQSGRFKRLSGSDISRDFVRMVVISQAVACCRHGVTELVSERTKLANRPLLRFCPYVELFQPILEFLASAAELDCLLSVSLRRATKFGF
jgi:hypothetical protein